MHLSDHLDPNHLPIPAVQRTNEGNHVLKLKLYGLRSSAMLPSGFEEPESEPEDETSNLERLDIPCWRGVKAGLEIVAAIRSFIEL